MPQFEVKAALRRHLARWAGSDIRIVRSARFAAAILDGASAVASSSFASRNRRPHQAGVGASPPRLSTRSGSIGILADFMSLHFLTHFSLDKSIGYNCVWRWAESSLPVRLCQKVRFSIRPKCLPVVPASSEVKKSRSQKVQNPKANGRPCGLTCERVGGAQFSRQTVILTLNGAKVKAHEHSR